MLCLFPIISAQSQAIDQTIKIAIMQPFGVNSSTGSTRYKSNFENAVYYALGKNENKINQCGAKYLVHFNYFSANALVEARDLAESIDQSMYWLLVGPTGAKHMNTVADTIKNTPVFSLSSSIEEKKNKIISTSRSVNALAIALARNIGSEGNVKNYGVLIDFDCVECIAFEKSFTKEIKKYSINRIFRTESKDFEYLTNLDSLLANLDKYNTIDALLVPNYSKLSGYVMSQVHAKYPKIIFLGGDGWGNGDWSYLPLFNLPDSIEAYSTRTYLSDIQKSGINSLDLISGTNTLSPSDLSFSVIHLFDEITNLICEKKLTSRSKFIKYIEAQNRDFLNKETDIGIYKLHNGKLKFEGKHFESN